MMKSPPHPGETLREDVLPALGLTVTEAAAQLRVTPPPSTTWSASHCYAVTKKQGRNEQHPPPDGSIRQSGQGEVVPAPFPGPNHNSLKGSESWLAKILPVPSFRPPWLTEK